MKPLSKHTVLLAGAGHAHIGLLRRLSAKRFTTVDTADDETIDKTADQALNESSDEDTDICLISEQPDTIYSGMLPGWMAGHYQLADISIDTKSLCL